MGRGKKPLPEGLKVMFVAVAGWRGGGGIFGIEDEADEIVRQVKLRHRADCITAYDRDYEGERRRCPRCGR